MKAALLITSISLCCCCVYAGLVKPLGSVVLNDCPKSARLPLKYYVQFPSKTLDNIRKTATFTWPYNFDLGGIVRQNVPPALDKVFLSKASSPDAADVRIEADLASFLANGSDPIYAEMGIHYRLFAHDGHEVGQFISVTSHRFAADSYSAEEGIKIMLATCLDDLNQKLLRKKDALISFRQDAK